MPIVAITPDLSMKKSKFNREMRVERPRVNSNYFNSTDSQSSTLVDYNYGKSLIKCSSVSFGANAFSGVEKLSKNVSIVANNMTVDDVLLIGKDFDMAKKALKESVLLFQNVIKKMTFIKDESLENVIAIKKNQYGNNKIINLGDTPIILQHFDSKENRVLKRNGLAIVFDNNIVTVENSNTGFFIDKEEKGKITDIPSDLIKQVDFSTQTKNDVHNINLRILGQLDIKEASEKAVKKITFADVGGQDEAIEQIQDEILLPMKYPNFFSDKVGGLHSALFVGPPGNGKSLAAQALSNEAGVPFYNMNGQLLEGKYVGDSAHNIHDYYEKARANQPCILFFDEADAIFGKRNGEHTYADKSVNMHLDEISKLEKENAQVYIIAATNHPELMDEGAIRNGRFEIKVEFKNPDTVDKCKSVFTKHTKLSNIEGLDIDDFAKKLLKANLSGVDIASVVKQATKESIKRQGIFESMQKGTFNDDPAFKLVITGDDFNKALEKIIAQKQMVKSYSKEREMKSFGDYDKP